MYIEKYTLQHGCRENVECHKYNYNRDSHSESQIKVTKITKITKITKLKKISVTKITKLTKITK